MRICPRPLLRACALALVFVLSLATPVQVWAEASQLGSTQVWEGTSSDSSPALSELEATEIVPPALETGTEKAPRSAWQWMRIAAGFAVTTGLKYAVGGIGPTRMLPALASLGPLGGTLGLVGFGLLEAGISIAAFQAISGLKTDRHLFGAFLLATASTSLLTPLLLGPLGPLGPPY